MTYVSTLLPPDMACQMLNAFLVDARVATELTDYISAVKTRLASRDTSSQQNCKLNPREQQDATIIDVAKLQGTPAQPEQSTGQANACTVPAPRGPTPLVVYYQVVRSEDRDIAAKIGYRIPPEFPTAGIEYVAEKDPSKQAPDVRFYQADQRDEAKYLACLVTSAYRQAVPNSTGEFNTHSLEKPNRKLPAHRIEVWFPPLGG